MTEDQVAAVQGSFAKVVPIAEQASALFYGRLFEIAPETRVLFKGDLDEQGRKLMKALFTVVNSLSRPEEMLPVARALAVRHVGYGVKAAHYPKVGEALLWTLREGLGEAFDRKTEEAWATAYTALSGVMIEAAYGNDSAAAEVAAA